jgi:hypothetical protein
LFIQK